MPASLSTISTISFTLISEYKKIKAHPTTEIIIPYSGFIDLN